MVVGVDSVLVEHEHVVVESEQLVLVECEHAVVEREQLVLVEHEPELAELEPALVGQGPVLAEFELEYLQSGREYEHFPAVRQRVCLIDPVDADHRALTGKDLFPG